MKIDYKKKEIYLSREDLEEGICPINERWAISMLRMFGPGIKKKGVLYHAIRCPEVAKKAFEPFGWKVIIEGEGEVKTKKAIGG
ncbi:MAG: hypothetical protein DRP29_10095 [Thermodesulfobacteriota bacterium]|nr:MAG: hypothetical protein DRP29_10095 [Thermodesulfobacteriota bacterium]